VSNTTLLINNDLIQINRTLNNTHYFSIYTSTKRIMRCTNILVNRQQNQLDNTAFSQFNSYSVTVRTELVEVYRSYFDKLSTNGGCNCSKL